MGDVRPYTPRRFHCSVLQRPAVLLRERLPLRRFIRDADQQGRVPPLPPLDGPAAVPQYGADRAAIDSDDGFCHPLCRAAVSTPAVDARRSSLSAVPLPLVPPHASSIAVPS